MRRHSRRSVSEHREVLELRLDAGSLRRDTAGTPIQSGKLSDPSPHRAESGQNRVIALVERRVAGLTELADMFSARQDLAGGREGCVLGSDPPHSTGLDRAQTVEMRRGLDGRRVPPTRPARAPAPNLPRDVRRTTRDPLDLREWSGDGVRAPERGSPVREACDARVDRAVRRAARKALLARLPSPVRR